MTPTSSPAHSTASTPSDPAAKVAQSKAAWELVVLRHLKKSKQKCYVSKVLGRAGLLNSWTTLRREPDLRASVIVKLAKQCRMSPSRFLQEMLKLTPSE